MVSEVSPWGDEDLGEWVLDRTVIRSGVRPGYTSAAVNSTRSPDGNHREDPRVADRRGADAERVGPHFFGGEEYREIKMIVHGYWW